MIFTDSHCHIYTEQFDEDRLVVVNRSLEEGVLRYLLPAIDSSYTQRQLDLVATDPSKFFPMYGLHPCSVKENWKRELQEVEKHLFNKPTGNPAIAVGEIGIDLYWDKSYINEQVEALQIQIDWAKKLGLPIVIHVRNGFDEIFEVIDQLNDDALRGVFHCFTGNLEQAKRILNYGEFKLGIGGVLTFKNSGLERVVEQLDLRHLILETDSPYLAPHPKRGKRNEPSYLKFIARKLAEIKGVLIEEGADATERNVNEVFFPYQSEH